MLTLTLSFGQNFLFYFNNLFFNETKITILSKNNVFFLLCLGIYFFFYHAKSDSDFLFLEKEKDYFKILVVNGVRKMKSCL